MCKKCTTREKKQDDECRSWTEWMEWFRVRIKLFTKIKSEWEKK